jgi:hypothetical protein
MSAALQASFPATSATFSNIAPIENELITVQRETVAALSAKIQKLTEQHHFLLGAGKPKSVTRTAPQQSSFEERIFGSLASLKVAVSQYAMHLSSPERHRIFDQLDFVINEDDWHEEDNLPRTQSFQDFLKWMIYSKYFQWTSIGVSDEGNILVAWKTDRVLLTANFASPDNVRWTAQISSESGEVGHTVGKCPLRLFSEQALFFLRPRVRDGGI